METVSLRIVAEQDAHALAELRIRAMEKSLEAIGRFDPLRAKNRFLDHFTAHLTQEILVNDQRAGFIVVYDRDDHLYIDHFYVDPQYQSKGIGSRVLAGVCEQADQNHKPIRLGALKGSRSNEFYKKHGFVFMESGEWDNYYRRMPREIAKVP